MPSLIDDASNMVLIENDESGYASICTRIAECFNSYLSSLDDICETEVFGVFIGYGYFTICSPGHGALTHQSRYDDSPVWSFDVLNSLDTMLFSGDGEELSERLTRSNNALLWWTSVPNGKTDSFYEVFRKPLKRAVKFISRAAKSDEGRKLIVVAMPPLSSEFDPDFEILCRELAKENISIIFENHFPALFPQTIHRAEIRFSISDRGESNTVVESFEYDEENAQRRASSTVYFQTTDDSRLETEEISEIGEDTEIDDTIEEERHDESDALKVSLKIIEKSKTITLLYNDQEHVKKARTDFAAEMKNLRCEQHYPTIPDLLAFLPEIDPQFYMQTFRHRGEMGSDALDIEICMAMQNKVASVASICATILKVRDLNQLSLGDMCCVYKYLIGHRGTYIGTDIGNNQHRGKRGYRYGNSNLRIDQINEIGKLPANYASICWRCNDRSGIVPYYSITKENAVNYSTIDLLKSIVNHFDDPCPTAEIADELLYIWKINESASAMFVAKVFFMLEQDPVFAAEGLSNPIEEITQSDDEVADVAISSIPIEELGLSVRAYNALKRSKRYNTIGDFSTASYSDLCKVRNLGRRSIIETLERLEKYGVNVKRIRDQIAESDRRRQE